MIRKNRDDIVRDALSRIGVAQSGQDIADEDMELGRDRLQQVVDDLAARQVTYLAQLDSVDNALAMHLASLTAVALVPDFGGGENLSDPAETENKIRLIQSVRPSFAPLRTINF